MLSVFSATMEDYYEKTVKVALMGNSFCGKSSLALRFDSGEFPKQYRSTMGFDVIRSSVLLNRKTYKLAVWDLSGQERVQHLCNSTLRNTSIIFFCYSIDCTYSFEAIDNCWLPMVKKHYEKTLPDGPYPLFVLVGNKKDLFNRAVKSKTAADYARTKNMYFMECSAKNDINVSLLFASAITKSFENRKKQQEAFVKKYKLKIRELKNVAEDHSDCTQAQDEIETLQYKMGLIYEETGEDKLAVKAFENVSEDHDKYSDAQSKVGYLCYAIGLAYREKGQDVLAMVVFENVFENHLLYPLAQYEIGLIHYDKDDSTRVTLAFTNVLKNYSNWIRWFGIVEKVMTPLFFRVLCENNKHCEALQLLQAKKEVLWEWLASNLDTRQSLQQQLERLGDEEQEEVRKELRKNESERKYYVNNLNFVDCMMAYILIDQGTKLTVVVTSQLILEASSRPI